MATPEWVKTAKAGSHVVCLRTHNHQCGTVVQKGYVYEISGLEPTPWERSEVGISLRDVYPTCRDGSRGLWLPEDFRPAVLPKALTDILTSINTPKKERV